MMRRRHDMDAPPRWAERWLDGVLRDPITRAGLVGDLREAYAERRRHRGRWNARIWYWRQTVAATWRYGALRFRPLVPAEPAWSGPPGPSFSPQEHARMANLIRDVHYALRTLMNAPGMTAIAVLTLTLGTGLPTIMFTVVNGVFRDLPVPEPDRVLRVGQTDPEERGGARWYVRHHDYADWRAQQGSFVDLAGFAIEDVTLSGGTARPLRRNAAFVTPTAFDVLGISPILGRSFREDDARSGALPVAVIGHGVWQSRFAGDPAAIGRMLTVDGIPHTVVGVMPPRFGFPEDETLWLPLTLDLASTREESPYAQVFGRLAEGVTHEQAGLEMNAIAARLAHAHPATNAGLGATTRPYGAGMVDGSFARGLVTMLAAVSFVLVIACVNVANLLLARVIGRTREIAVRTALGASRRRVISQFLIESLVIATAGGVLGVVVTWLGVRAVGRTVTSFVGLAWVDVRIDPTVLAFVGGVVLLSGLLAGVLPALRASAVNVHDALKETPRGSAGRGARLARVGGGLVVVEIALSCALLVVSALLIEGVLDLLRADLGIPADEIVTGEIEVPRQTYATPEARIQFFASLEASVAAIPGVTAVALMSDIPGTIGFRRPVVVDGETPGDERPPRAGILTVTPDFLPVLGATVLDGRGFTTQDRAGAESVVLINRRLAETLFPDRRAVGRVVRIGQSPRTVIGVVPDLYMGNVNQPDPNGPGLYIPFAQTANVSMQIMVRTAQNPESVVTQVRDALARLDPTLAMMDVGRVDRLIRSEIAVYEVFGRLFLGFGLVALALAAIGLYGVMTFTVRRRTREWGLRMALGATAGDVVRLATKHAALQLVVGVAIGLAIAGAMSGPLSRFFFQVEPWNAAIFGAITLLLSVTAVIATLVPVRRATQVDPLAALRDE